MLRNSLLKNDSKFSYLQKSCINKIADIFDCNLAGELRDESYYFTGVRGRFQDKENYCACFNFDYQNYNFQFYLSYDQLEYYILKKTDKIVECNLEDFWEDDIMTLKFITSLKKDLDRLKVPCNKPDI